MRQKRTVRKSSAAQVASNSTSRRGSRGGRGGRGQSSLSQATIPPSRGVMPRSSPKREISVGMMVSADLRTACPAVGRRFPPKAQVTGRVTEINRGRSTTVVVDWDEPVGRRTTADLRSMGMSRNEEDDGGETDNDSSESNSHGDDGAMGSSGDHTSGLSCQDRRIRQWR